MHVHHLAIIWDLENSVCHLQMKHRGSISFNCSCFAALILLLGISPHSEYFDICQEGEIKGVSRRVAGKKNQRVRLWWGQAGRPHYTAQVVHPLLWFFCSEFYAKMYFKKKLLFFSIYPSHLLPFSCFFFLTDESTEEEAP